MTDVADAGTFKFFIDNTYYDTEEDFYIYAYPNESMQSVIVVELLLEIARVKLFKSYSLADFEYFIDAKYRRLSIDEKAKIGLIYIGQFDDD